jgi:hypothetical protein
MSARRPLMSLDRRLRGRHAAPAGCQTPVASPTGVSIGSRDAPPPPLPSRSWLSPHARTHSPRARPAADRPRDNGRRVVRRTALRGALTRPVPRAGLFRIAHAGRHGESLPAATSPIPWTRAGRRQPRWTDRPGPDPRRRRCDAMRPLRPPARGPPPRAGSRDTPVLRRLLPLSGQKSPKNKPVASDVSSWRDGPLNWRGPPARWDPFER